MEKIFRNKTAISLCFLLLVLFVPLNTFAFGLGAFGIDILSIIDISGGLIYRPIAQILMTISSFILLLSGLIFDFVIKYTVLDFGGIADAGNSLGQTITDTWGTLRDIANMVFIFVLLYTAFKAMFLSEYSNVGQSILRIILIALLINFSLFFTKVVIDASNIVARGFYDAITDNTFTFRSSSNDSVFQFLDLGQYKGISSGYLRMLGLQSVFGTGPLEGSWTAVRSLIVGGATSVIMLLTAIIFLIVGVMFMARFVILIFLMILSPVAFIAYTVPGLSSKFGEWWNALINQAFFAPLYFALTWVVFKVGDGFVSSIGTNSGWSSLAEKPNEAMGLIMGYLLIMGLSIAALVFSKQMASKTYGFTAISGAIGGGAIATSAWFGRQTVGNLGSRLSSNVKLQEAANKGGFWSRTLARPVLYAAKEAKGSAFDVRNATIPTRAMADAVEGTIGRTRVGKALGLDDVNVSAVNLSSVVSDMSILGKGGTKGYAETKAESAKRVRERETAQASELAIIQAKQKIKEGASDTATTTQIDDMEKALAKLSDKETEALVASNRELLKSLNFANTISVKQLEAINKSDQFSEIEKGDLRNMRFKDIDTAVKTGTAVAINGARKHIRDLADSELEMINPTHLENTDFVSHLKSSQFESINKSSKFTTSQKDKLRAARRKPLADALLRRNVVDVERALKTLGPKEIASIDISMLKIPTMLEAYKPQLLKRMAPEMNPSDILELRDAIETAAKIPGASANITKLNDWLSKPDGSVFS